MESKYRSRLIGMLGFAMRAGRVTVGADLVCASLKKIKERESALAVLSCTASDATKRRLGFKCEYYGVKLIEVDIDSGELGRILGKAYAPAVVLINDAGFAREIATAHDGYLNEARGHQSTQRKEVSDEETGEPYAASSKNNSDN